MLLYTPGEGASRTAVPVYTEITYTETESCASNTYRDDINHPHKATHGPRRSHIPAPPHGGHSTRSSRLRESTVPVPIHTVLHMLRLVSAEYTCHDTHTDTDLPTSHNSLFVSRPSAPTTLSYASSAHAHSLAIFPGRGPATQSYNSPGMTAFSRRRALENKSNIIMIQHTT